MRRPIQVFGVTLEDGSTVTTDNDDIVAIKVMPDKTIHIIKGDNEIEILKQKWVGYTPRFN